MEVDMSHETEVGPPLDHEPVYKQRTLLPALYAAAVVLAGCAAIYYAPWLSAAFAAGIITALIMAPGNNDDST